MSFEQGELLAYCYMVQRGKPAAMLVVKDKYVPEAVSTVTTLGLNVYTEALVKGWTTLWIYKYHHILEIIKTVPDKPETVFDHWVLGKLFGYDDHSIKEFLDTKH